LIPPRVRSDRTSFSNRANAAGTPWVHRQPHCGRIWKDENNLASAA